MALRDELILRIQRLEVGIKLGVKQITQFGFYYSENTQIIALAADYPNLLIPITEGLCRERRRLRRFDQLVVTQQALDRSINRAHELKYCTCDQHDLAIAMSMYKIAKGRCRVAQVALNNHRISLDEIEDMLKCLNSLRQERKPTDNPDKLPANNPDKLPANYPDKLPANYPDKLPANNPDKLPANYPDKLPANNPDKLPANNPDKLPANNPDKLPANNHDYLPVIIRLIAQLFSKLESCEEPSILLDQMIHSVQHQRSNIAELIRESQTLLRDSTNITETRLAHLELLEKMKK